MKKYDEYKDSGVEWIGEVPSHWEKVRIKHLAIGNDTLFLDGDWIESKDIVFDENNIRYITTGNIGEGKYKEQGSGHITEETFEKLNCTEVFPGDLIISRLNPPIGRACIIPEIGKRIVTSVDNVILRPNDKYSKNFLRHFFTNTKYYEHTLLEGRGATMQRISRSILGNIEIVTPPIEEQTAIADYLDQKTAEIDALIADKKQLLDLYEEEKTAVINQAVTKGINPDAKMKDSGIDWLGEVPEHWEVKRLKYVGSIKYGLGQPPKLKPDGLPIIRATNIFRGTIDEKDLIFVDPDDVPYERDPILRTNDIVVVRSGAYTADSAIIPSKYDGAVTGYDMVFRSNIDHIPQFIAFSFLSDYILKRQLIRHSLRAAQPHLNREELGETLICLPPPSEQQAIVEWIGIETDRINTRISNTQKLIDLLTEYRTALISEVVTGKVKVWDEQV